MIDDEEGLCLDNYNPEGDPINVIIVKNPVAGEQMEAMVCYACGTCGLLIADPDIHRRWHRKYTLSAVDT